MKTGFLLLTILVLNSIYAQTAWIKDAFRKLPAAKVYSLSPASKDSLLAGKTYYPSDNTFEEVQAINYGSSTKVNDYMYVSFSFETNQRGEGMIEIRGFRMKNGQRLVVVSETAGVRQITYHQKPVSAFLYTRNKKLLPYRAKLIPPITETGFLKRGAPKSIKAKLIQNANLTIDFSNPTAQACLNSNHLIADSSVRKWLKGECVSLVWQNDRFVIGKYEF